MQWKKIRPKTLPTYQIEQFYCQSLGQDKADWPAYLFKSFFKFLKKKLRNRFGFEDMQWKKIRPKPLPTNQI